MTHTLTAKVPLSAARPERTASVGGVIARTTSAVLRVPLVAKLLGANVTVAGVAWVIVFLMKRGGADASAITAALAGALLLGTAVNVALTWLALRPIREIERTIWGVWHGDSAIRVTPSPIADADIDDIGQTVNALLDHLDRDRARMQELATEIIRAEARERARVGENLRESIAQSVAAISYQLTALVRECDDPVIAARVGEIRFLANQTLDEIDVLSHSIHPRVLNDFGLVAGLRMLAREVATTRTNVEVSLSAGREEDLRGLGLETSAALFRVAQEAVQNAVRHANATQVTIAVGVREGELVIRVTDNGTGFDVAAARQRRPGMGLFTMRQRMALIGGACSIDSAPGRGTSVQVTMPAGPASYAVA